jgi:SSS family solute:Na+ symporter
VVVGTAGIVFPPLSSALLALCPAGTVIGLPALVLNVVVTVLVSLVTRPPGAAAVAVGIPHERVAAMPAEGAALRG